MFNKLSLLALVAPLAQAAITLNIPQNPVSGGDVTISWTSQAGDPDTFTLELNNEQFHKSFAIANNVFTAQQSITLTLPVVPIGDGYTLMAVNIGNINDVFSTTGDFAVAPNPSSVAPSSSSTAGSATATAPTASKTTPASVTGSHTAPSGVSSGFGSTVSGSPTVSGSANASGAASTTAQGDSASSSATPLNGAMAFGVNKAMLAGALLSALAGAVVVAF